MATVFRDLAQMKTCPYNPAHRVKASRYQSHVSNCGQQFALMSLKVCPFNATHRIPEDRYSEHVISCPENNMIRSEVIIKAEKSEPKEEEDESLMPHKDLWIDQYVEVTTSRNYDILKKDSITAEELFERREKNGEDTHFLDTIYLHKMSYEQRKRYQTMCVEKIKEISKADEEDIVDVEKFARKQNSNEWKTNKEGVAPPSAASASPSVDLRPPNVLDPFGKKKDIDVNSETASDKNESEILALKYRGAGIGRGTPQKNKPISYHKQHY